MAVTKRKYTSIQVTHSGKTALDKQKRPGESFEDMLRRKKVIR